MLKSWGWVGGPCDYCVSLIQILLFSFFWETFIRLGDLLGQGLGPGFGPGLDNIHIYVYKGYTNCQSRSLCNLK